MKQKLYVSGYWPIAGNVKRSGAHYSNWFPQTLQMLRGADLIFYSTSEDVLEWAQRLCVAQGVKMLPRIRALDEMQAWSLAGQLVQSCERMALDSWDRPSSFAGEKGVVHYWRDLRGAGADVFRCLNTIWLCRTDLLAQESVQAPDHVERLAWIDSTMARFNGQRSNWRFWMNAEPMDRVSHYASPMRFYGRRLAYNGSYVSAPRSVWPEFAQLMHRVGNQAAQMAYGHDDETIVNECVRQRPELFHCLGLPYKRLSRWRFLKAKVKDGLIGYHPKARI